MGGFGPAAHVGGTTVGINDVQRLTFNVQRYNLQGQRVSKAEHGLFIINGKKVVK